MKNKNEFTEREMTKEDWEFYEDFICNQDVATTEEIKENWGDGTVLTKKNEIKLSPHNEDRKYFDAVKRQKKEAYFKEKRKNTLRLV